MPVVVQRARGGAARPVLPARRRVAAHVAAPGSKELPLYRCVRAHICARTVPLVAVNLMAA